ncbi:response regulator [Clostridium sp. C8-1-8]|uniref:response regulator n=1 Tax=Clostridium sp. C8-1-8 TaxID=2698831 RepID=UPI001369970E|nr:response regulator [Clostridium sp. C8-1-8]
MYKILVVDDEVNGRKLIKEIIGEYIDEVCFFEASNGKNSLELVSNDKPDLLILDYKLPDIDGLQLCRILKEDMNLDIKTILITGMMYEDLKGDTKYIDSYIAKPYDEENLINIINTLRDVRG